MTAIDNHTTEPDGASTTYLVGRAQAGSLEAWTTLYNRYNGYVRGIALGIVRDVGESEDLCHDVFIQAMEKIFQIKNPSHFGGWIGQIAYRKSINSKAKRKPLPMSDSPLYATSALKESAEDAVDRKDEISHISAKTPAKYREQLDLRLGGYSRAEIAVAAGRTAGSVGTEWSRIVKLIKSINKDHSVSSLNA